MFQEYPCIVITSKGFPDLNTRACVWYLSRRFGLPVFGLGDCNTSGIHIIEKYFDGGPLEGIDGGDRFRVEILWLGLRPSQVLAFLSRGLAIGRSRLTARQRSSLVNLHELHSKFLSRAGWQFRLEELALMEKSLSVELNVLIAPHMPVNFLKDYVLSLVRMFESRTLLNNAPAII